MYIEWSYMVYLVISVVVTVWVARTLYKNGLVFLVDSFGGNGELARSVNHLLVVGFYLINLGYVVRFLATDRPVASMRQAIEMVSEKLGVILLVLGAMHFFNLYVFNRIRNRGRDHRPPVAPDARITTIGL
jgi:hypothetical protein